MPPSPPVGDRGSEQQDHPAVEDKLDEQEATCPGRHGRDAAQKDRRPPAMSPGREYEPDEALFAGESGLEAYRALAPELPRLLNQGGLAAVEIGHDQAEAVKPLLAAAGLSSSVAKDIADRPRALLLLSLLPTCLFRRSPLFRFRR